MNPDLNEVDDMTFIQEPMTRHNKTTHLRASVGYEIYYDKPIRMWVGFWTDNTENQIGECVYEHERDDCLVTLGMMREDIIQGMEGNNRNKTCFTFDEYLGISILLPVMVRTTTGFTYHGKVIARYPLTGLEMKVGSSSKWVSKDYVKSITVLER